MDHTDTTETDISMHEHEDEELVMEHVIQNDPELMYLHVCLSELLCNNKQEQSV